MEMKLQFLVALITRVISNLVHHITPFTARKVRDNFEIWIHCNNNNTSACKH